MPITEPYPGWNQLGRWPWLVAARDRDTPEPVDEVTMQAAFAARIASQSEPESEPDAQATSED